MKGLFVKKVYIYIGTHLISTYEYALQYAEVPQESVETCKFGEAQSKAAYWISYLYLTSNGKCVRDTYYQKIKINSETEFTIKTSYLSWDFRSLSEIMSKLSAPEFIEYLKDNKLIGAYSFRGKHPHLEITEGSRKRKYYRGKKHNEEL